MYSLLDIHRVEEYETCASIRQGSDCVLRFSRADEIKSFLDLLLISRDEVDNAEFAFNCRARQFTAHRRIDSTRIGLVSDRPTLLHQLSVLDNLELIAHRLPYVADQSFHLRVRKALQETGLLAGINLAGAIESLPWTTQIEINFLQAWLSEPQWLIFDSVFEHLDQSTVAHLPALFRQRYPLRALTYLQLDKPLPSSFNAQQEIIL